MKLSQLNTEQTLDKIMELTPYITEIVEDQEIRKILADKIKVTNDNKEDIQEAGFTKGLGNILKIIPILLKNRRNAVYGILSVMNNKQIEEIKIQPLTETLKQINELLKDEELKAVFTSLTI